MKLLMVGPTPEPYTGQSVSFQKLKDTFKLESGLELFHVETSPRSKSAHVTGKFGWNRIWDTLGIVILFAYFLIVKRPDSIYLTKGSTKFGFFRDFILMMLRNIFSPRAKFIVHLKGGNYDHFYESCSPWLKRLVRIFLTSASRIIVLGNSLIKMYDFMPKVIDKIVVVENALTFDVKQNKQINKSDRVTFLFLSNLIFSKGYTHLAEAAVKLVESKVDNFEIVFAGDFMQSPDDPDDVNQQKELFLKVIRDNNEGFISYIETVNGEGKKDILNKADVLVLPTNYHVEGQPVSIIEAMAYSCAIITTNYRSIPDLVDNKNSKYVEYANVNDLAQQMELLIRDRNELASMCKHSREKFNSKFTWECHYQKMRKVILS